MSANLSKPPLKENVSTSLTGGISPSDVTMTLSDVTSLVFPCYVVIDRVDSSGNLKAFTLWEYVKVTNIVGSDCTITRAQGGSTAQAHSASAIVESVSTAALFTEWHPVLNTEHNSSGGHVITGTMTIAGMNLASVATIAVAGIGTLNATNLNITNVNASGASVVGFPLIPNFAFVGTLAGATTLVQTPLVMPRTGTWDYVNFWTRTVASGVSAIVDINLNGTSIFDAVGRPMIAAGGTFVSTASIKTKAFTRGNRISWDYDSTSGSITDFDIMLVSI